MVQFATLDGATQMPPWCAVSLASLQMVRVLHCILPSHGWVLFHYEEVTWANFFVYCLHNILWRHIPWKCPYFHSETDNRHSSLKLITQAGDPTCDIPTIDLDSAGVG